MKKIVVEDNCGIIDNKQIIKNDYIFCEFYNYDDTFLQISCAHNHRIFFFVNSFIFCSDWSDQINESKLKFNKMTIEVRTQIQNEYIVIESDRGWMNLKFCDTHIIAIIGRRIRMMS